MALAAGTRIGAYEISAAIGAGGMGEVYRARDTKLDRAVAIKILPEAFAADTERIARFQREAKTLALLNHPNIAHIHGLEESDGVRALVMELVEGEDLAQRIGRGAIPPDEALPIAKQVTDALEAAHEQGIIHRDLKPANIKVRPDGTVKVLDFGLAKAMEPTGVASPSVSQSPTITTPAMTQAGMILGTAAYMSPEQARGKPVDKRADIWAFGCVFYEMLTGRRAFEGEDVSDTLAAILRGEPDWTRLPALPSALHTLLRRCLERDWRRRIGSMSVVRFVLDEPTVVAPSSAGAAPAAGEEQSRIDVAVAQGRRRLLVRGGIPLVTLTVIALAIAGVVFSRAARPPSSAPVMRLSLGRPEGAARVAGGLFGRMMALSPSGDVLVYITNNQVLIRRLSNFELLPVSATDLGTNLEWPAFSPDGQWIAYYSGAERTVKRVSIQGGAALRVCDTPALSVSWDATGILVSQGSAVVRCNPAGGTPESLVRWRKGRSCSRRSCCPAETPCCSRWPH